MALPRPPASRADNLRGAGFMLIAMAAFTVSDAMMKLVSEEISIYQATVLRALIMLPMLWGLGRLTGGLQLGRVWAARKVAGWRIVGEIGATITFFIALLNLPLPIVTAILQSAPLMVTGAAALFMGEKVGLGRMLVILIGFMGVLIIVRPGPEGVNIYAIWALISVMFITLRDLSTRALPADVPSVGMAFVTAVVIGLVFLGLSAQEPWHAVSGFGLLLILGSAILVNVGYIFIIRVMRVGDVGFTTPFRYSALLWALGLGMVVWGFFPDALTLVGAAIVVVSGVVTLLAGRRAA